MADEPDDQHHDGGRAPRAAQPAKIDPPHYSAPWYRPAPVDPLRGDPEWGLDDPAALPGEGPIACGTAFGQLCEEGLLSWRRSTREVAARGLRWLDRDGGRFEPLDVSLGIKASRNFSYHRNLVIRDALLVDLARFAPFSGLAPTPAAKSLRAACERWQADCWPRYRPGAAGRPPPPEDRAGHTFFQIGRLALSPWLPNEWSIARLITEDRSGP